MSDRVGFIGLGAQGAPMARRIAESGIATTVWARRPDVLEAFADSGAAQARDPAALAARSDIVCLCVVNDDDVEEVAGAVLPSMRSGNVLVVQSTVHPSTVIGLATTAGENGITVIDAPVSGGGPAAAEGRLEVIVGADDQTFARCRPVFETYGDPVVHVGGVGTAQLVKLINNVLFMAQVTLAEDAFAVGEAVGVSRADLAHVLGHGSGNSFALGVMAALGSLEAFADVGADRLRKDVAIVEAIARDRDIEPGNLIDVANDGLTRSRANRGG